MLTMQYIVNEDICVAGRSEEEVQELFQSWNEQQNSSSIAAYRDLITIL